MLLHSTIMVWIWNVSQRLICRRFPPQGSCVQRGYFWEVTGTRGLWCHQQVNNLKTLLGMVGRGSWLKEIGHWGHDLGDCPCPLSFSTSWLSWPEQFSSALLFHQDVLLHLSSKVKEPAGYGLKTLKPRTKINLYSSKLFFAGICHSDEKLTNTTPITSLEI